MTDYYYWPKELAYQLEQHRKIRLTVDRIRVIRKQSEADRDGTFIDGRATVDGVMQWLRDHPHFVQRPNSARGRRGPSISVL